MPPIQAHPEVGAAPKAVGKTEPSETETVIADAVNRVLARPSGQDGANPFPRGTRLLTAHLELGVASLDFSSEFNALADSGETTESNAQKALRNALSSVPGIDKMRVTVEGKPFQSQATDWNTPFPVKSTDSGASAGGEMPGREAVVR